MADERMLYALTTPPMKDGDKGIEGIAALQKALTSKAFLPKNAKAPENPGKEDGTGVYGTDTAAAVHMRKFWMGYPEGKCNGHIAGERFRGYLFGDAKPTAAMVDMRRKRLRRRDGGTSPKLKALKIALAQKGIKESPANTNKVKFSAWYGLVGPWCFAAGTQVDTPEGLRPIEYLQPGDVVFDGGLGLAEVGALLERERETWTLRALGLETTTTADHPYMARKRLGQKPRAFGEAEYLLAGDLRRGDLVGIPVSPPGTQGFDPHLARVLGLYMAEGHRSNGTTVISTGHHEAERTRKWLDLAGLSYREHERRTCAQFTIHGVASLAAAFGSSSRTKTLPGLVYAWDREALEALVDGYAAGDGHRPARDPALTLCGTVSRSLAYGMARVLRILGLIPRIQLINRPPTTTIEGRFVNQATRMWMVSWLDPPPEYQPGRGRGGSRQQFERGDGVLWVPVRTSVGTGRVETVYDLSVPRSQSFVADGAWVHNCVMFQAWVGAQAKETWAKQGARYASVAAVDAAASQHDFGMSFTSNPEPGDLVTYDWDDEPGPSNHIGRFVKWTAKGKTFQAIEGNTSTSSNSNGGEVMLRTRDVSLVHHFIHLDE